MLYVNRHKELCFCSEIEFKQFAQARNVKKLQLMENDNEIIKLWEDRIDEIRKTGNFVSPGFTNMKYFSDSFNQGEMIMFCERMIERLKQRSLKFEKR